MSRHKNLRKLNIAKLYCMKCNIPSSDMEKHTFNVDGCQKKLYALCLSGACLVKKEDVKNAKIIYTDYNITLCDD